MWGISFLVVGAILLLLSHLYPNFAIWYARFIYPIIPHTVGRFISLFPFSVNEVLMIILLISALYGLGDNIIKSFSAKGRAKLQAQNKKEAFWGFTIFSALFLHYVLFTGMNYNRESFADHIGITVQDSSTSELVQLYKILVEKAEGLADQVQTDEAGFFVLNQAVVYDDARQSMQNLNNLYGGLGTYFPQPKALRFLSNFYSKLNIGGFISILLNEANYNPNLPDQNIPFTIAHELAHAVGHYREDEANFIAYLACINSENIDFQYSALYSAIRHTLVKLRTHLCCSGYRTVYSLLPQQIQRDFVSARTYQQAHQGTVGDIHTRINDVILKLNQQTDGVQSYGRMVDLLLAYYRDQFVLDEHGASILCSDDF
jgi:hypothetical protein